MRKSFALVAGLVACVLVSPFVNTLVASGADIPLSPGKPPVPLAGPVSGSAMFQPSPPPPFAQETAAPAIKMVEPGVFEVGGVRIFKKEGKVEFPAEVNMDTGLLEYLVVGNAGKLHESLLRTKVEPYSLQVALLLLGLEGTVNPLAAQGDPTTPTGDPVSILVRPSGSRADQSTRIEQWVLRKDKPMDSVNWIFTGSVVHNGVFMAQIEKSIVAVYHDPMAMIDNPSPEGGSDEVWFARKGTVPAPGTPVDVVIQKQTREKK